MTLPSRASGPARRRTRRPEPPWRLGRRASSPLLYASLSWSCLCSSQVCSSLRLSLPYGASQREEHQGLGEICCSLADRKPQRMERCVQLAIGTSTRSADERADRRRLGGTP